MTPTTVTILRPDGDLPVLLWQPQHADGAPAIVLVQEIFGLSTYVHERAADLAAAGYLVAAPDLYRHSEDRVVADDDPHLLERGMALMQATDWDGAVADVNATVAALRAGTIGGAPRDRVGLVGFCYGGGLAYAAAATTPVQALVSYYGSALPNLLELSVTAPSLHHFGDADAFIPADVVERIRAALTQAPGTRFELHPGAGHAFDNPLPAFHHAAAAAAAWPVTLDFLAAHLGRA